MGGKWDEKAVTEAGIRAVKEVAADCKREGRLLTEAVIKNADAIHKEVFVVVYEYARRFGERWQECVTIGAEVPVRLTIEGTTFASHMDLVFRDTHNVWGMGADRLGFVDFKWRDTSPTAHYLCRNPQFLLYQLGCYRGKLLVDGMWVEFGEWPSAAWIHLPYLKPYLKMTTAVDENGEAVTYLKGDSRPDKAIFRWIPFLEANADMMAQELLMRPRMYALGIYPMNPDPIGCHVCPSNQFCFRPDMPVLSTDSIKEYSHATAE